jgi:hypothetical protein
LHDAAEDTPHTVDKIVQTLKEQSNGVLKDEDAQEIYEALNLLYFTRHDFVQEPIFPSGESCQ